VVGFLSDNKVAEQVADSGTLLLAQLNALMLRYPALIRCVRGRGLLCALEFHEPTLTRTFTLLCAEEGLLVVPTRNGIIRLLPDLLVSPADIESAVAILDVVCRKM
jgi:acetylornithine/succinyldiaminopimelate/putrescine aminotransferase